MIFKFIISMRARHRWLGLSLISLVKDPNFLWFFFGFKFPYLCQCNHRFSWSSDNLPCSWRVIRNLFPWRCVFSVRFNRVRICLWTKAFLGIPMTQLQGSSVPLYFVINIIWNKYLFLQGLELGLSFIFKFKLNFKNTVLAYQCSLS